MGKFSARLNNCIFIADARSSLEYFYLSHKFGVLLSELAESFVTNLVPSNLIYQLLSSWGFVSCGTSAFLFFFALYCVSPIAGCSPEGIY